MADLTPPSNPRRGVIAVAAAVALVLGTVALVVAGSPTPASAQELARFRSCDDLSAWGGDAMTRSGGWIADDQDVMTSSEAGSPIAASSAADAAPSGGRTEGSVAVDRDGSGATNVAVEGVDELDLVDRLDQDRVLVAGASTLSVVDVVAAETVDSIDVPVAAQITFDADARVAWVVGQVDGGQTGVEVSRVAVASDGSLALDGTWRTGGMLVDARRVGDRLHLVAADGFAIPFDGPTDEPVVPFEGGPVPCDQVLHPAGPSDPTATLLVTLPVSGVLEPEHATEVVGAGNFVHVTTDAAYLATPLWDAAEETALHRFDLSDLSHTGSGRVQGHLLDEFSMSEADGNLRVAVTVGGGRGPMVGSMLEGDVAVAAPALAPADPSDPDGSDGAPSDIDQMPVEPRPPGRVEPEPMPDEPEPMPVEPGPIGPMPPIPPMPPTPPGEAGLNEVVVLDTAGGLDVIGRTERFGHAGETLHGIRFAGAVAYAVTFLQTDPFYVIDLSTATSPTVVGEVELPGFSSYLHPISDALVVGFGPNEQGRAAAKLFDVSDPAKPTVVDDLTLGDDSPVAWDHHAFLDLGDGRFAVPASTYGRDGTPDSAVVVVDTSGGRLTEQERQVVTGAPYAQRVIDSPAGWALLTGDRIVMLDRSGNERAALTLR